MTEPETDNSAMESTMDIAPYIHWHMSTENRVRAIAFYLPQFHPIPENDEWWGKGFTEWINVAKARPLFRGHYQPKVPADLGFYDLRVPEVREQQSNLARAHGLEAFCYYDYWFAGKRLLERPFSEVLSSGRPQFPFCLCWANQTWSGIWHGAPNRTLIEQTYPGAADHVAHFRALEPAFHDPRYLRVEGKPVFMVFSPKTLPDVQKTTDLWRELAARSGLNDFFLIGIARARVNDSPLARWVPQEHGFDASASSGLFRRRRRITGRVLWNRTLRFIGRRAPGPTRYSYKEISATLAFERAAGVETYPCVTANWDNTPRSGRNGYVYEGATPELFRQLLKRAIAAVEVLPWERRLVFIKSWNEWAEGNYLEPDLRFGHGFLEVLKQEVVAHQDSVTLRASAVEPSLSQP
jgi:hypothetical protein